MMRTAVRKLTLVLAAVLPVGDLALAEVARFEYEAVVTSVDVPAGHPVQGRLAPGDVIRGTLQYDLELGDYLDQLPTVGIYEALPAGVNRFQAAGGRGFMFDSTLIDRPAFAATVDDGPQFDTLLVRLSGDTSPSTLQRPDTAFVEMGLLLETNNTRLFSSDALPERLSLDDFELAGIDFFGTGTTFPTFLVHTSITALETMPQMLPGDFNASGLVEQADLDLALVHWGQDAATVPSAWSGAPPVGIIDQAELDAALVNWGAAAGEAGAVPEAATLALIGIAAAAALSGEFRRRLETRAAHSR